MLRRTSRATHTDGRCYRGYNHPMDRRLLTVADKRAFSATCLQQLERRGLAVLAEPRNGGEWFLAASGHPPDMAFVAVQLPGLDGLELAERFRALALAPEVILTSSLDGTDLGALVASSSALGFIPKAELSA